MATLGVRIRYRPVRIGWCIRQGSWDDLRRVLRLTHTLWGGRFNPIIPIGRDAVAKQLTAAYRVDALYPASDDSAVQDFIGKYPWLRWPSIHKGIFLQGSEGPIPTFLDISHPVHQLYEEFIKNQQRPRIRAVVPTWEATDPLSDVFSASFGSYPSTQEIERDYADFVQRILTAQVLHIDPAGNLPVELVKSGVPSSITKWNLIWDRVPRHANDGFYVGDSSDFDDVTNFWNLRAADLELYFFDPAYESRLARFRDAFVELLGRSPSEPMDLKDRTAIWSRDGQAKVGPSFGNVILMPGLSDFSWSGLRPPLHYIDKDHSVLGSIGDDEREPTVSFSLPAKPFNDERSIALHNQLFIVSISPSDFGSDGLTTFRTPFIPELNDFYRREMWLIGQEARVESFGLGIVTSATSDSMAIRAMPKTDLIASIFGCFGMTAEISTAGRIATRLIHQMGGLQKCRVFKIRGVRDLIEKYGPLQSLERTEARQVIGQNDCVTHLPNFSAYENLYIEPRERGLLKPDHAFQFLLKKGVFQTGLNLRCGNCELDFWLSLDSIATEVKCEYCGTVFNITPQLKDRNWAYRRSGLFGRENSQEGGIPVALTLQQLDTILHWNKLYVTAMKISPNGANIAECETDFVAFHQDLFGDRVSLVIGECKTRKEITQQDADNLRRVADAFPPNRVRVYILFSKLTEFSPDEIEVCRSADTPNRPRVILLSARELEPYRAYEFAEKEFHIPTSVISLDDMVEATNGIYFSPRLRPKKITSPPESN